MSAQVTTSHRTAGVRDWRQRSQSLVHVWRRSLRFRALSTTLIATAFTVFLVCVVVVLVMQNELFTSRKDQVLDDARRAVASAQQTLDAAEVDDDRSALLALQRGIPGDLTNVSESSTFRGLPIERDGISSPLLGFNQNEISTDLLSDPLRERVVSLPDRQAWQSVRLPNGADGVPGIIVGQQLVVPGVGEYELYIAYTLDDANQILVFVQRLLWIAGVALILLIGAISWVILRLLAGPIVAAANTSERLAAGDLEVRIPVRGEDELATLGASFNAMADSIQAQIKELGELSLVQQRFVSDVSHELRTPLTTIRLAADMLNDQRATFDATTARTAELLHTQVQRFELLLADLLEISRYDAGSVQLEWEPTSLAQLAEDVVEQMTPLAQTHGSDLRVVAPGGYSHVEMDPRRVRRILRNLVGNAIEHGEGGPVVVTVDSNEHAVATGVRDFGLGMTPEQAAQVFDRFWRADPSRKRTIGGTGLGLAISLGDARLHGGTLSLWSEPGVGSNFVLTLPRRAGGRPEPPPVPTVPQDSPIDTKLLTQPIDLAFEEVSDAKEA